MARKLNMVALMTFVIVAMLHSSLAQTTHDVGGALGWIVPPGGDAAYRTWAATQTFTVGDVLVFNFTTGIHDVAEVSKASFDSCNATTPISMSTTGPTNITLTSAGEHLFICTFTSHCRFGQKLAINVSAASPAPPPQSTTPPPAATPVPTPAPSTYTVGDVMGWNVPPGGPIAYQTWARDKSFLVGDILVFNFTTGAHDVAEVTKAEFDSCTVSPSTTLITTGPARITLSAAGEHYYICTVGQHCTFGQKLAINVTGGGSTVTPPSSPAPAPAPSSGTPPPSSSASPPPSPVSPTSPSTPSTPPPVTNNTPSPPPPPPPSNSAPSFAVAALPFTFLAVALAFLYN